MKFLFCIPLALVLSFVSITLPKSGLFVETAMAQEAETVNSLANDMDQVDIYLHTIDVGNMVYDNFGHTAIRVVDHRNYSDLVYNWGTFTFGNPIVFAFDFYKGHLLYALAAYPYAAAVRMYRHDTRTVWEDKLILSPSEKETLLARLAWNMRPENREYSYQYFFDNCSTRPRDYINEALGGALETQFSSSVSKMTFRDFVISGYESDPGMDVLLDFGMNSRNNVRPLLQVGTVLHERPKPDTYPKLAYSFLLIFGGVPLIPIVFFLFLQQKRENPSKVLYRFFGGLSSLWLGFGAFWGFMMALSWAMSGHQDLHHNANMLLMWPIDVFAFVIAFMIFIKGQPLKLSPKLYTFTRLYCLLHILVSISMPCLRMLGIIEQNVNRVSVFLLPPYVVILLLIFRVGLRPKQAE
ncbi:MAG: DUF4105 domain-containing protein [Proteobacteria bacterium]|nr:MAG: DUF4105 domain-containing protein [Pseudomonadota bacterium]